MKFFFDTEFVERGSQYPITLISVGIVSEDGREFYAESSEFDANIAGEWVRSNVLPHLSGKTSNLTSIGAQIRAFVGTGKPEFWAYYGAYDWVVLCQIFGTMMDLPNGWPMYCNDLKQELMLHGNPQLPPQTSQEHNALSDAHWTMNSYNWLSDRARFDRTSPNLVR